MLVRSRALLATGLIALGLAACSTRQGYDSAQAWQRNACQRIVDAQERLRCMKEADQPYDRYQKEAEALKAKP